MNYWFVYSEVNGNQRPGLDFVINQSSAINYTLFVENIYYIFKYFLKFFII